MMDSTYFRRCCFSVKFFTKFSVKFFAKLFIYTSMFLLVSACSDPAPGTAVDYPMADKPLPKVVSATEAIESPDIPTIDPATLDEAEINKVVPAGKRCDFQYTSAGKPIMAVGVGADGMAKGVIKIHGRLVEIASPEVSTFEQLMNGGTFQADPIHFDISLKSSGGNSQPALAHFRINNELTVGYSGYYQCHEGAKRS